MRLPKILSNLFKSPKAKEEEKKHREFVLTVKLNLQLYGRNPIEDRHYIPMEDQKSINEDPFYTVAGEVAATLEEGGDE